MNASTTSFSLLLVFFEAINTPTLMGILFLCDLILVDIVIKIIS